MKSGRYCDSISSKLNEEENLSVRNFTTNAMKKTQN